VRVDLLFRRCVSVAAVVGLLSSSMSPAAAAPEPPKPVTHRVAIDATSFQPMTLTVKAGDTIVWVNKDPFPHTVTSEAGGFDSRTIAADESWSYKASKKGEFPYICSFHPTMTGTLRVK
jgi:plastocyanin